MGKSKFKKLSLKRETLRALNPAEMRAVAGGRTRIRMKRHRPGKNAITFMTGPTATCCGWTGCADSTGSGGCASK